MIELDPEDVRAGLSSETMERRALALIGRVDKTGYRSIWNGPGQEVAYERGLPRVCSRITSPLPHGCWDDGEHRSPYALYGAERWCDACIAYAALQGTLPRPQQTIDAAEVLAIAP